MLPGSPAEFSNRSRTGVSEQERFAGFALTSHVRLAQGESCFSSNLFVVHLVKAPDDRTSFPGDAAQFLHEFLVRTANDEREGLRLVAERCNVRKVPGWDDDCASVFHDEGVGISDGTTKGLNFGLGLAGAKNHRDVMVAQMLERSGSARPRIRMMIEQGTIQIGEDECARSLRDGERPPLR